MARSVGRDLPWSGIALIVMIGIACAFAVPAQAQPLEGTDWVLTGYDGNAVIEDTEITARFEDGNISGSAGCNRYFGAYEASDGALTFGDLGRTLMACPEPIMAQEDAYLKLLEAARGYYLEAGQLYLMDDEGMAVLEFVRADLADQTLEGVRWSLVRYDGNPVLDGTEITAWFEDGRVSGSAGCNRYFAAYEVDDLAVSFSNIGSTRMACPGPIMAQESAYLGLLQAVRSYGFEQNQVSLLNANGEIILSFLPADVVADISARTLDLQPPGVLRDGRFWAPMRPLLDWLGAEVDWDEASQTASGSRGDTLLEVTPGRATALVNGESVALPSAAFETDGRTYIPLRLLTDAFDVGVDFDAESGMVTLTDGSQSRRLAVPAPSTGASSAGSYPDYPQPLTRTCGAG